MYESNYRARVCHGNEGTYCIVTIVLEHQLHTPVDQYITGTGLVKDVSVMRKDI